MIDGRKSTQYVRLSDDKSIYVYIDNRNGQFECGINGTGQHYSFATLNELKCKVNDLATGGNT